jgi:opacity protein-like surface antigen
LIAISATLAALAAPAFASGPVTPQPAPPVTVAPVPVAASTDWTGPSVGAQLGYGDVGTSGAASLEGNGALLGLRAYYDFDFGSFVAGAGLQYDRTDIDLGGVTTLDSVTRLALRGGVDLGQSWIYGTGGLARADTSNPVVGSSNGYFIGAGYEMFLTENLTAGAEVLYHQFDDFDLSGLEVDATTVGLSLNLRF